MNGYERQWLAGLLEGEGSFCLDASQRGRPHLIVSLQMCDQDVVERAARLMKGRCLSSKRRHVRPNEAPSWRCKVGGATAEQVMRAVRPHMGKRRGEKIDALLRLNLSHHPREVRAA